MREVGIDIVELDRVANVSDGFIKHVLSDDEIKIYNDLTDTRKIEYLGGRFATKEAIIKCLSDIEIPNMNDISILNRENGKPYVVYKDYNFSISISHEKHYAVAIAILE